MATRMKPHVQCVGVVIGDDGEERVCTRSASEIEDGLDYCVQHAPSRRKRRRDALNRKLRHEGRIEGIERAIGALDEVGARRFGEARATLMALLERVKRDGQS